MCAMNRLALWTTLVLLGLAVAIVDLFTGWTVRFGPAALVALLRLFGGSVALFVAMLIAVIRDRRWIVAGLAMLLARGRKR
jgi:ethanolamine transporter EutH